MNLSLKFRLHSSLDFSDPALAEAVIGYLVGLPRFFRPWKYGTYEPLKSKVKGGAIRPLIEGWLGTGNPADHEGFEDVVFFMDTEFKGSYMVGWGASSLASLSGRFQFSSEESEELIDDVLEKVDRLAGLVKVQYGQAQDPSSRGGKIPYDLRVRLPDIPPVSMFGPIFIEFFGKKKIERAPYLRVSEREYGFWLEASESVFGDVSESRRKAIRAFLGDDCFMAIPRRLYGKGHAPRFQL